MTYQYYYADGQLVRIGVGSKYLDISYDASGVPMALYYSGYQVDNAHYYYVTNVQGDVVAILNDAGTAVVTYTYDAWGNILSVGGSMAATLGVYNPLRYRGYVYDQETSLYYLQNRYYDPNMGRFINSDVLAATGQGVLGNNMFAYCGNNPVSRVDHGGNFWDTVFDVVSLCFSVAEVISDPTDVGAWVGLALDVVDVAVPFVGGLGETARAVDAALEVADKVDDIHDAGKAVDRIDDATDAYKAFDGGMCFVAGTLVHTSNGYEPIESIVAGDYVWAWDETTGEISLKNVVETYINETDIFVHVFVDGEEIITTPAHPFYSPIKGWTDAVHLRAGDILVLVNGEYVIVEKIQHEILETPVAVYNFNVEDFHTYYVSGSGVLVHNSCNKSIPQNYSPDGAGRHGAFNQAKRDMGIPVSQQPTVLPNIDKRGNIVPGRVYDFGGVQIRDDVLGHTFKDGGYLPPHFNTPNGRDYFY